MEKLVLLSLATLLLQLTTPVLANPCEGNTGILFVPADTCEDYFTCVDDVAFPQTCPDGFYFDFDRQMCYPSDQVTCNNGGADENPCAGRPHWSFVPRPSGGCGAYYRCDNEVGVPLECPEGFYFDEANQKCNFADDVDCDDSPPTAPTPVPTEPTGPTDPTDPTTEPTEPTAPTPSVEPTTTTDGTVPPPTTDGTVPPPTTDGTVPPPTSCVGRPDGSFVADPPRGCAAFQRCNGGVGEAFFCPEPFHFDFHRQMCNWADVVNCQF